METRGLVSTARGDQRTLLDVIDKVCAGNSRPGALVVRQQIPGRAGASDQIRSAACATVSPESLPARPPVTSGPDQQMAPAVGSLETEGQKKCITEHSRQEGARHDGRMEPWSDVQTTDIKLDALSESLSRKLERIAYSLGIRNLNLVDNSADDAEDRKRLMEKLKSAFDNDRRRRLVLEGNERDKSLDYFF